MVNFCFNNSKIVGISTIVPKTEKVLTDDKLLYNGDEKRIKRVINSSGFLKRRVVDENTTSSDLCLQAAENLIENLNVDKHEIDALIFVSYTPDYLMPATSYVLHKRLALSQNCIVMDIPQACSGYIIGLFQASMLINAGCRKVLLLVGDCFSKFSDMFKNHTAPIFGDAGSATLIEYSLDAGNSYFSINSDGNGYDSLMCTNGGFRNIPTLGSFYEDGKYKYDAVMDGGRIFEFTMENIAPSIENLMNYANLEQKDINCFVFHQANKFILENIARKLNIDETLISTETLTNFGNQCGASIPCTISNTLRTVVGNEKKKVLMSGFGVGLSWATAILDLNKIYCSKLEEYRGKNV